MTAEGLDLFEFGKNCRSVASLLALKHRSCCLYQDSLYIRVHLYKNLAHPLLYTSLPDCDRASAMTLGFMTEPWFLRVVGYVNPSFSLS